MEKWKSIKGYQGMYEVSNMGNVRACKRTITAKDGHTRTYQAKDLKKSVDGVGYLTVTLSKECRPNTRKVHKLVAEAFLGHTRSGYDEVVDHINHDKHDNRLGNLRLLTHSENLTHRKGKETGKYYSKYTGVTFCKTHGKWLAYTYMEGKRKHIGIYLTEEEAYEGRKAFLKSTK